MDVATKMPDTVMEDPMPARSGGGGSCRNARRDAGSDRGCHSNTGAYGNA